MSITIKIILIVIASLMILALLIATLVGFIHDKRKGENPLGKSQFEEWLEQHSYEKE